MLLGSMPYFEHPGVLGVVGVDLVRGSLPRPLT
jgi:hypothetical protein